MFQDDSLDHFNVSRLVILIESGAAEDFRNELRSMNLWEEMRNRERISKVVLFVGTLANFGSILVAHSPDQSESPPRPFHQSFRR